jgi:hypothetical protein
MKLSQILLEQEGKPRALVMAGGGGAGKSYLLSKINTEGYKLHNPDTYVEDPNHPMHQNLSAASNQVKKDVLESIEKKESFIWDTTGRSLDIATTILDAGYDLMVIMVYTHPIISFTANFERERSIPKSAVFSTWQQSYDLIDGYRDLLGNNFILVSNLRGGEYEKKINDFNKAAQKGGEGILQYLDTLIAKDPKKYQTSFAKPFEIEDPEALEAYEEETRGLNVDLDDESMVKQLKRHFMSSWNKKGVGPGRTSMEKKMATIERGRDTAVERNTKVMDSIADMVTSSEFNQTLNPEKDSVAISKANKFLA